MGLKYGYFVKVRPLRHEGTKIREYGVRFQQLKISNNKTQIPNGSTNSPPP
jgi:hypothetical protein